MTKNDASVMTALEESLVQHPMNIPAGHLHRLKELSAQNDRPMQSLVREAINDVLTKYAKRKPKRGNTSKRTA